MSATPKQRPATPAPWVYDERVGTVGVFAGEPPECLLDPNCPRAIMTRHGRFGVNGWEVDEEDKANAAFIASARNAFDVMMRRGWGVVRKPSGWFCAIPEDGFPNEITLRLMRFDDPFTALVESDRWYRENVEIETTR